MDGHDHMFRQRVAQRYSRSSVDKKRLWYCILFHYILFMVMLAKLAPSILDYFSIFILEIEELEVPEPYLWEWIWLSSFALSYFSLEAVKRNKINSLKCYIYGIVTFGYLPLLYSIIMWFGEVYTFLFSDDYAAILDIVYWKTYPYGLLWYAFIFLALQVHSFAMYFSYNLLISWKTRIIKKSE
ncbi:protein jagunal-like [Rhynchophorus ferrugineus]|uniref:protein jagunal-like n=1 Tax=Rhynchophorus ferrugineus TaxID=354439 RepID=UPI003FCD93C9